jgi:hypothetical protein
VTGAAGEVIVDTTKDTLTVHDAYTAGGTPLLREDLDNLANNTIGLGKIATGTQGQVLYYNASGQLVTLSPGTSGYALTTRGTGQNPEWAEALPTQTGNSGKFLTTNGSSSSWNYGPIIKISNWQDTTKRTFSSVTQANYEAVSGSITRVRSDSAILVTGQWYGGGGIVNYPSIGQFFRLNNTRRQQGVTYTGRDSDGFSSHSMVGFNVYFSPSDLSSTTGSISWAWGWNYPNNANSAVRPLVGINSNAGDDGRVPGSQEGSALTFWEFIPGIL